jgi:hypothetical protein
VWLNLVLELSTYTTHGAAKNRRSSCGLPILTQGVLVSEFFAGRPTLTHLLQGLGNTFGGGTFEHARRSALQDFTRSFFSRGAQQSAHTGDEAIRHHIDSGLRRGSEHSPPGFLFSKSFLTTGRSPVNIGAYEERSRGSGTGKDREGRASKSAGAGSNHGADSAADKTRAKGSSHLRRAVGKVLTDDRQQWVFAKRGGAAGQQLLLSCVGSLKLGGVGGLFLGGYGAELLLDSVGQTLGKLRPRSLKASLEGVAFFRLS